MYDLRILPPAAHFIKKLRDKHLKQKFQNTIDRLLEDPYYGVPKTGDLSGVYSCDIYHNKINYELAYTIIAADDKVIVVLLAGTRENFYKELKRYMKSL